MVLKESPKSDTGAEAQKAILSEKKSVGGFFGKLFNRFNKAVDSAKMGRSWQEKVAFFFTALFSEVKELKEIEKQIDMEAASAAGDEILKLSDKQIIDAVKASTLGDNPDPRDEVLVDDFAKMGVGLAREVGAEEFGVVTTSLQKLDSGAEYTDELATQEKLIVFSFGLKTLAKVKKHPDYDSVGELTDALDRFGRISKAAKPSTNEDDDPSTAGLIFPSSLDPAKFQELFMFTTEELMSEDLAGLRDKLDVVLVKVPGFTDDNAIGALELQEKLTGGKLSDSEALRLQRAFARLFPNTSDNNRAKVLQIISEMANSTTGSLPSNRQIAELIFALDTKDLESLAKTLHP